MSISGSQELTIDSKTNDVVLAKNRRIRHVSVKQRTSMKLIVAVST